MLELHLKRGEELLGVLHQYDLDQPWFTCKFEPTAGFSQVRHLFQEELELLESDQMDEWQIAYERIHALGLKLIDIQSHKEIDDFLLHIQGTEAWFRY
jgi:hypothetical protein